MKNKNNNKAYLTTPVYIVNANKRIIRQKKKFFLLFFVNFFANFDFFHIKIRIFT